MHWPSPFKPSSDLFPRDKDGKVIPGESDYVDTYKAMEACFKKGKAKAIGVSNFSKGELERLLKETSVVRFDSPIVLTYELDTDLNVLGTCCSST